MSEMPKAGFPQGAMAEFIRLSRQLSVEVIAIVNDNVSKALATGKPYSGYKEKLAKKITDWRNRAQPSANGEMQRLWSREQSRYGTYYRGKIKGITKSEPPEIFPQKLAAIDAVANSVYFNALDTINKAITVNGLLKGLGNG